MVEKQSSKSIWGWLATIAGTVIAAVIVYWITGQVEPKPGVPDPPGEPPSASQVEMEPPGESSPELTSYAEDLDLIGSDSGLYYVDLDTGEWEADEPATGLADIQLFLIPDWYLEPKHGAQAALTMTSLGLEGCSNQTLSSLPIQLTEANLRAGVWFCAITNEDRVAEFWLRQLANELYGFSFSYRIWN